VQPICIDFAVRVLPDVDFADNVVLLCEIFSGLKITPETLSSAAEKLDLEVNWSKTRIMDVDKA